MADENGVSLLLDRDGAMELLDKLPSLINEMPVSIGEKMREEIRKETEGKSNGN